MTMLASMGVSIMLRSNLVQYVCNNFLTTNRLSKARPLISKNGYSLAGKANLGQRDWM